MKTKTGFYKNMPEEQYINANEYISCTGLKHAKRSLKDFQLYMQGYYNIEGKSHFDFGNAVELALLDSLAFHKRVAVFNPDERPEKDKTFASTTNKYWKGAIYNSGKYVINEHGKESFSVIEHIRESCMADKFIRNLIKEAQYPYTVFWNDMHTGLQLKTRLDICLPSQNILVDIKTTRDGSPEAFSKDLAKYDYPFRAVMQIDACLASGLMERVDNYFWLVLEKEAPFSATLYEFAPGDIVRCDREYQYIKSIVKQALDTNQYPSYSQRADNNLGILTAQLPLWY